MTVSTQAGHVNAGVYGQRGALVRTAYLAGACAVWCLTLGGRLGNKRPVVLCYHGVSDSSRENFARHVRIAAGRAITLAEAGKHEQGQRGKRTVCFTFDDAFANLLRNALPAMAEARVPSVVFAVSGNLGETPKWEMRPGHPERDERIMTPEELRQAEGFAGCRVEGHTRTHVALARISNEVRSDELRRSKMELEAVLGHDVKEIAAPYGSWSSAVLVDARSSGYTGLLTLDPADTGVEQGLVGRYLMTPETSALEFRLTIDGAYAWVFGLRRMMRAMKGGRRNADSTPMATAQGAAAPMNVSQGGA